MNKTLVIMAAGMGSRYGSLKQIDPIGPDGALIIDYSIYDAVKAGFNKVVFIIKKENEEAFREAIGNRIEKIVKTEYVFQNLDNIPEGYSVPEGRVKPWGTAHAVLSCLGTVKEPFAVINSDDFYGREAFQKLSDWMEKTDFGNPVLPFCMVGFILKNTLTENGHVSRGICKVDDKGQLIEVVERTKIMRNNGNVQYTDDGENWIDLSENSIASMNCWGFPPKFLDEINNRFPAFMDTVKDNPLKAEFFLPFVVSDILNEKKCTVDVLTTDDKWFGVTYKEDRQNVVESIAKMVENKTYPENMIGR